MPELDLLAVALTAVIAFVGSGTYYAIMGGALAAVSLSAADDEGPPTWTFVVELVRTFVVVGVVAVLVVRVGTDTLAGGLLLGLVFWIGFPLMLWVGAILHERTPVKLAAIHAGDWLIKLVVSTAILSLWL